MTTIADQVHAMNAHADDALPADVEQVFTAEQTHLRTLMPRPALAAGAVVDDAALLDPHGRSTSLSAAIAGRPAVLVFYRGAWCPYCNLTLKTYEQNLLPALKERHVGLVAISPQTPDGSLTAAQKNALSFAVLSDVGNQIARQLGILTAPSAQAQTAQQQLGLDLTQVNADGTAELPMPSTLIVDADRTLRWLDVHPDYTTRSEVTDILVALDTLGR